MCFLTFVYLKCFLARGDFKRLILSTCVAVYTVKSIGAGMEESLVRGGGWGGGVSIECCLFGHFLFPLSITGYPVDRNFGLPSGGMCV